MNLKLFSTIIFFLFTALYFPQSKYSIEGSLGIISPINSSAGLSTSLQLNYSLYDGLKLFFNASYSSWDRYNVFYNREYNSSVDSNPGPFKTFSSDDHSLVAINFGSRFKLHESKIINLFLDTQLGLSFFTYNNYILDQILNPETGQIDFVPNLNTRKKVNQTLFSVGVGPVFERKINSAFSLYLSAKINTMINAGETNFISKRGTYFLVSAGFTHVI